MRVLWSPPSFGSCVHGESRTLEQQRKLTGRHGSRARPLGELQERPQPTPFEPTVDQVQAVPISHDGPQLRSIFFHEEDAVAVVGLRPDA